VSQALLPEQPVFFSPDVLDFSEVVAELIDQYPFLPVLENWDDGFEDHDY